MTSNQHTPQCPHGTVQCPHGTPAFAVRPYFPAESYTSFVACATGSCLAERVSIVASEYGKRTAWVTILGSDSPAEEFHASEDGRPVPPAVLTPDAGFVLRVADALAQVPARVREDLTEAERAALDAMTPAHAKLAARILDVMAAQEREDRARRREYQAARAAERRAADLTRTDTEEGAR